MSLDSVQETSVRCHLKKKKSLPHEAEEGKWQIPQELQASEEVSANFQCYECAFLSYWLYISS